MVKEETKGDLEGREVAVGRTTEVESKGDCDAVFVVAIPVVAMASVVMSFSFFSAETTISGTEYVVSGVNVVPHVRSDMSKIWRLSTSQTPCVVQPPKINISEPIAWQV